MDTIDEWQLELNRMLDVFGHESESSLRKIGRRFDVLVQPFGDEFRQYFLKISTQRLGMSFTKIEIERWGKSQDDGSRIDPGSGCDHQNDCKTMPNCSVTTTSTSRTTVIAQLPQGAGIHLNVKSEKVIEIIDSDDDDSSNQDAFERIIGHTTRSGNGNSDEEVSNDLANVEGELKLNAPVKDESNTLIKIERMDETESIPMVAFDPFLESHQSTSAEPMANDSRTKQQSSSSPMAAQQSNRTGDKRFKCEHCDSSFQSKYKLEQHQPIHENGKFVGVKADSNGLYQCAHCVRQFTKVSYLSQHMKSHNQNQHLHDCARCMHQFTEEADKDRHESQCEGRHYQCHLCKVFVTARMSHMQYHMRTHSGVKPFHCLLCGKPFINGGNLRCHLNRIHTLKTS